MNVFKAKMASDGSLDKLKGRIVARGDLQGEQSNEDTWSGCVNMRTVRIFIAYATSLKRKVKQLDFIGAYLQAQARGRIFIELPKEYSKHFPDLAQYFNRPIRLNKTIYGLTVSAKYWNEELSNWLKEDEGFKHSTSDANLWVRRYNKENYIILALYVDDALYFGDSTSTEESFLERMKSRFNVQNLGDAHWFLGVRIHRYKDGSYTLDQNRFTTTVLRKFCPVDAPWGQPSFQETPAPLDYVFSIKNRPKDDDEKNQILIKYPKLVYASAVCTLLYLALGVRGDLLWVIGKLTKACTNPGLPDYRALMWCLGYLRKFKNLRIKFYANPNDSPVYKICRTNNINPTDLIGFSDSSWQDCPDTGRSTTGFQIFYRGSFIEGNSSMPVPVAMNTAEAEYMGACNCCMALAHANMLIYDLKNLDTENFKIDGHETTTPPTVVLVDNKSTVQMSKNYQMSKKNRHISRRYHYVREGEKAKRHSLTWISGEDQLADITTKTQEATKINKHLDRVFIVVPDFLKKKITRFASKGSYEI